MDSAVSVLFLPECGMRTCHKENLDPIADLGKLGNMSV